MIEFPRAALESGLPDRFDAVVRECADRPAVVWEGGSWTYRELSERAWHLASRLLSSGPANEATLLLLGHGAEEIAGMFACAISGSAYVVLDPVEARAHLRAIASDAGAARVVCSEAQRGTATGLANAVIELEDGGFMAASAPRAPIPPDTLATIVYTSGSTGEPKGVMRSHRCVLHRSLLFRENQQVDGRDRIAHMFSCSFAAAEVDVYGALLNGATLCIYPTRQWGIAPLADWLLRERITLLHPPPTLFRRFLDGLDQPLAGSALRCVSLAGEAIHRKDLEQIRGLLPGCALQHRYSSSETSVVTRVTFDAETRVEEGVLPVGLPVSDKQVRLVDADGNEVAAGEIGEIEVRSRYLADGYWRRPDLTRARFHVEPDGVTRSVRTGDLANWRPDGLLQHRGRADRRVKVRGHRVELEAVEAALSEQVSVAEAAVVAREDGRGETRLGAWVVAAKRSAEDARALRSALSERLPAYAIPAHFEFVDALPTTPTGKVDRKALALRVDETRVQALSRSAPDARDGLEYQLRVLWQDVMDRREIGVDDDFFDLGGDSIQLADVMLRVERLFGEAPTLEEFVAAPTIAAMARRLRGKRPKASFRYVVPLRTGGSAPPFFCVHPMTGSAMHFVGLARHFAVDRPLYGLQARGIDGCGMPHTSIEAMASDYLGEVRRVQPRGPYYLGGRCLGGDVAAEMARQLIAAGESVGMVAVFDTQARRAERFRKRARRRLKHLRKRLLGDPYAKFVGPSDSFENRLRRVRSLHRPQPYPGTVTLFTTHENGARNARSWMKFAEGRVEIEAVPGEHFTILREPHVRALAQKLEARLVQASREQASSAESS